MVSWRITRDGGLTSSKSDLSLADWLPGMVTVHNMLISGLVAADYGRFVYLNSQFKTSPCEGVCGVKDTIFNNIYDASPTGPLSGFLSCHFIFSHEYC